MGIALQLQARPLFSHSLVLHFRLLELGGRGELASAPLIRLTLISGSRLASNSFPGSRGWLLLAAALVRLFVAPFAALLVEVQVHCVRHDDSPFSGIRPRPIKQNGPNGVYSVRAACRLWCRGDGFPLLAVCSMCRLLFPCQHSIAWFRNDRGAVLGADRTRHAAKDVNRDRPGEGSIGVNAAQELPGGPRNRVFRGRELARAHDVPRLFHGLADWSRIRHSEVETIGRPPPFTSWCGGVLLLGGRPPDFVLPLGLPPRASTMLFSMASALMMAWIRAA